MQKVFKVSNGARETLKTFCTLSTLLRVIGVYDSGVGGLSVWGEIVRCLPEVPLLYVGDQAHVPYGARTLENVRELAERNARWLLGRGCDMIVVACNTASAVALQHLRHTFPHTHFVGMEPALKPAARQTQTGVIGILATPVTFRGPLYASLMARYSAGVTVLEQPCRDWVDAVEHLEIQVWKQTLASDRHSELRDLVARAVEPLLEQNADTLVLGCTHFPFLLPVIQQVIEHWRARHPDCPPVNVIDPAPAVARQTAHVWQTQVHPAGIVTSPDAPSRTYWTTGEPAQFERIASLLLGQPVMCAKAVWDV